MSIQLAFILFILLSVEETNYTLSNYEYTWCSMHIMHIMVASRVARSSIACPRMRDGRTIEWETQTIPFKTYIGWLLI